MSKAAAFLLISLGCWLTGWPQSLRFSALLEGFHDRGQLADRGAGRHTVLTIHLALHSHWPLNGLAIMVLRADDYDMKMLSDIAKDALELSPGQRLTLARILLDLSEPDQDFSPEVEAAWEQEIVRRMDAVKAGNAQSRSFERVFAELDRRFPS